MQNKSFQIKMFDKWQCCLFSVLIVVILAASVENRSYNNGLIFYDTQAHNVFLPPTVSVSRGRGLASVKYSSKGSIWSTFGKPCECSGVVCGCCAGVRVRQFDFDQKMCANVTFLAEKHEAILDVYLNKVPSSRYGISARNPSPICIPIMLPIPMAMCVQMSDIAIKGNNLHMCMDFVVRLVTTDFFEMHFQCMQMGLDGVQYLDKNGKPVLPIGSKTQVTLNQKHSQEENEYDDEDSLNENEVDSNENKVEQNDYNQEEEDEEENVENEVAPNDTVELLNTVAVEAIDSEKENTDEDVDDENIKNIKDDDADAQSAFIAESVTNMQNLTTDEITHEKLDGNTTLAVMQAPDMHKLENLMNAATISPMVTTTTTSTTTATNAAGNNAENVDAVTDKANDADANEYNDNSENDGGEQIEDEDDDNDDDDDESENEDSDEEDEDDDDDYEDENNNEHDVADDVGDDVSNNDENDSDAIATKIITEFSTSYAQPQPDVERISVAAATVANQAASITLPFVAASETSPGAEKTSSKRHIKLLNYRRARG